MERIVGTLLSLAVLGAACTSSIEDPSRRPGGGPGPGGGIAPPGGGDPGPGPGGGSGPPGNGNGNGNGNGGGGTGGGGMGPAAPADPGRVTLRRLNRAEYDNTVRDLLGTRLRLASEGFASDPSGFGYDNNADVQSLAPVQLDQYLTAAETLVEEATKDGVPAFAMKAQIAACDIVADAACQARLVKAFARRAFRRPVPDDEVTRLLKPAAVAKMRGDDAVGQLKLVLKAILSSPHFLFRVELDPQPTSVEPHPVNQHELAARLSYFLWQSMPDAPLFAAADGGRLASDAEVRAQTMRMLADPKAAVIVDSFAAQWLSLAALDEHQVDPKQFAYDKTLAALMRGETLALFREFLTKDLPASDLLRAPFTFVNDRLAAHYGLPAVGSANLTRVSLTGDRRQGLLTQAAVLTRTSFPSRTSPTVRGAWIATHLLCAPPPPPPPNVPAFPEPVAGMATTVRQRLEVHRTNPACAGCHALVDPIGLGLENYDLVGRYRTTDQGKPIDASGVLPSGEKFATGGELLALLATDSRVVPCVARNLMTYALGRGVEDSDDASVDLVVKQAASARPAGAGLQGLVLEVVGSRPFRMRRGEPGGSTR